MSSSCESPIVEYNFVPWVNKTFILIEGVNTFWTIAIHLCSLRVFFYFYFYYFVGYAEMTKQTSNFNKVFYEEKSVCNRGRVRYLYDLARTGKFAKAVTNDFEAAVCRLPEEYNQTAYFEFIEDWGTVSTAPNLVVMLPFSSFF